MSSKKPPTVLKLVDLSYDREMSALLEELASKFEEGKKGSIDTYCLNDAIHEYHNGDSRHVWKTYRQLKPRMLVSRALAMGLLSESEIPAEHIDAARKGAKALQTSWAEDAEEKQ